MVHMASLAMDGWSTPILDFDPRPMGKTRHGREAARFDRWRTWHATWVWVTVGSQASDQPAWGAPVIARSGEGWA